MHSLRVQLADSYPIQTEINLNLRRVTMSFDKKQPNQNPGKPNPFQQPGRQTTNPNRNPNPHHNPQDPNRQREQH